MDIWPLVQPFYNDAIRGVRVSAHVRGIEVSSTMSYVSLTVDADVSGDVSAERDEDQGTIRAVRIVGMLDGEAPHDPFRLKAAKPVELIIERRLNDDGTETTTGEVRLLGTTYPLDETEWCCCGQHLPMSL